MRAATTSVVPRWEWRTFGRDLGPAGERLGALAPDRVHDSDELYLLSREAGHAVKVRDGLLDVKELEEVDDDGLERWRPTMKARFPLAADDLRAAWRALGLQEPAPEGRDHTLEEIMRERVDPDAALTTASVHKHRRQYTLGGCAVELTDVGTGRTRTRTIAVESEDPALVVRTVAELGLSLRPNTSYPRALPALAGAGGDRCAVIDVGTNSVKLVIGESGGDGPWRTVADRAVVTRLGEGLAGTGRLQDAPMRRTVDAVCAMAGEARDAGAFDIAAVGTAGLRIAPNAAELIDAAWRRCGVSIEVIPGEEEARLGYLAARSLARDGGSVAVFETGGGSSQFTFGHGPDIDERLSVEVGAARYTERFGLDGVTPPERLADACAAIARDLAVLDGRPVPGTLVGIGGALTNLAAVMHGLATYAPDVVHGTVLDRAEIDRQIALYAGLTAQERGGVAGLQPARAEVILAGACIVRAALDGLGCDSVVVSDHGLRHGVIEQMLGAGS